MRPKAASEALRNLNEIKFRQFFADVGDFAQYGQNMVMFP